jgi:hypothetical protein
MNDLNLVDLLFPAKASVNDETPLSLTMNVFSTISCAFGGVVIIARPTAILFPAAAGVARLRARPTPFGRLTDSMGCKLDFSILAPLLKALLYRSFPSIVHAYYFHSSTL